MKFISCFIPRLVAPLLLLSSLFVTMTPDIGHADFRVCNDTKSDIGLALGYRKKEKWITEGWWQIPDGDCASLVGGDLASRFYYIYAEEAERGGQWRGEIFMCTDDREFKIEGVHECFTRGFRKSGFFEVDTGNRDSWMVRLTESGQSSGQPTGQATKKTESN